MQDQRYGSYSLISQKYCCPNCSKQFSVMTSTENSVSREVFCETCNAICERITETTQHPRQFTVFERVISSNVTDSIADASNENAPISNVSNENASNNSIENHNHETRIYFEVYFPVQEIIFISNPNATQNNQERPIFIRVVNPTLQQELFRRIRFARIFDEFLMRNSQENGTPPADKEAVKNLKEIVFEENELKKFKGNPCSICQEEFISKEIGKELKCKHVFHKECIEPWLNLHRTCPCCRTEVI